MEVLALKDIKREDGHIYYRRTYQGTAVLALPVEVTDVKLRFTIEVEATGKKDIDLKFCSNVDYPLLPIIKALNSYILKMDREGLLTC